MNTFDSLFFARLREVFEASREAFRDEIKGAQDYAQVQWIVGYAQAIDDIEARCADIERRLNGEETD